MPTTALHKQYSYHIDTYHHCYSITHMSIYPLTMIVKVPILRSPYMIYPMWAASIGALVQFTLSAACCS